MLAVMNSINDTKWIDFSSVHDTRGVLTSIESGKSIPFELKRIFYMHHIIDDRGGHAHTDTDQVVIATSGTFRIELYDGINKIIHFMSDPEKGLYVPRMIFVRLYDFSPDSVCLVLASTHYDMKKSIRSLEDYERYKESKLNKSGI